MVRYLVLHRICPDARSHAATVFCLVIWGVNIRASRDSVIIMPVSHSSALDKVFVIRHHLMNKRLNPQWHFCWCCTPSAQFMPLVQPGPGKSLQLPERARLYRADPSHSARAHTMRANKTTSAASQRTKHANARRLIICKCARPICRAL